MISGKLLPLIRSSDRIGARDLGVAHGGDALGHRQVARSPCSSARRRTGSGCLAGQQDADRPRREHRADGQPVGRRLVVQAEQFLPHLGALVPGGEREDHRPAAASDHAAQHGELGCRVRAVEVGDDLQEAGAGVLQPHGDARAAPPPARAASASGRRQRLVADGAAVEKPNAPARIASAAIRRMAAISPWLAGSSASARSPIT